MKVSGGVKKKPLWNQIRAEFLKTNSSLALTLHLRIPEAVNIEASDEIQKEKKRYATVKLNFNGYERFAVCFYSTKSVQSLLDI